MTTLKKLFFELLVFSYLYYIGSVTIVPSEPIDVIEGGGYSISIVDDDKSNFCACKYKSNLDQTWTEFEVQKSNNACAPWNHPDFPEPTEPTTKPTIKPTVLYKMEKSSKNIVSNSGNVHDCKVNVKEVDDQGPLKWSIIPDDWNRTYSKQADFTVNFFYAVPLIFSNKGFTRDVASVYEGDDFFQYLNTSLIFESCNVIFNGNTKPLNLKLEETGVIKTNNEIDQKLSERISSFGRDRCGFKVKNVIPTDNITWTLTGITSDKKKYRAVFDVTVYQPIPEKLLHSVEVVEVGKSITITCAKDDSETRYCRLYNPQRKLVFKMEKISGAQRCAYPLGLFQVNHYGEWKCISGNSKSIKPIEYTYTFIEKEMPYMSPWVEPKGDYLSIGCQYKNSEIDSFTYCKMTSPDEQVYILKPGRSTDRYFALETDFKNLKCGMEIKLPLEDNENGLWRCESDQGGAFINVGKQAKIDYQNYSKVTTRIGQELLILCEVPFYSSLCHIKAPNGTRYLVEDKKEPWLGKCSYKIKNVCATDNGTWTCSFAQKDGTPDEEILVEITIADMLSFNPEVKATEDYSFDMLCNSGGLPLDYCQFTDPNGKSYFIDNNVNSTYISYYGQGLEHGECGITISSAEQSDSGTWSCILQIRQDRNEISARISVEVSPNLLSGSNVALALGVTFGVVALTSLFALIAIRTIRQRRRQARLEITPTQPLNDTNEDVQGDIFSLNFPSQGYTNPQIVRDNDHQHQY